MSKGGAICLICLKKFGNDKKGGGPVELEKEPGYQARVLAPTSGLLCGDGGGERDKEEQEGLHKDNRLDLYSRFLVWSQRYLKLNVLGKRLLDYRKGTEGNAQVFCDECKELVGYLLDLWAELETVKLHLIRKVGHLERTMRLATKKVSQKLQRGLYKTAGEQVKCSARQFEFYRRAVILNCSKKAKGANPKIIVPRGLFPEQWKYTYQATKLGLMRLIIIFALASPPKPRPPMEIEPPSPEPASPEPYHDYPTRKRARRRPGPKSRVGFKAIATGVVIKKEVDGSNLHKYQEDGDDDEDAEGAFPDTGRNDNDSDWSRGAASVGSPDSNPEDEENNDPTPAKRRRLRTRVKKENQTEPETNDDSESDPDFTSKSKRSSKKRSSEGATIACTLCPKKFKYQRGLVRHLRMLHSTYTDYNCDVCGLKCATWKDLNLHKRQIHNGTPAKPANLPCIKCGRKFVDARGLSKHMLKVHKSRMDYICKQCGFTSKSAQENLQHKNRAHRVSSGSVRRKKYLQITCRFCNLQFDTKKDFILHRNELHATRNPETGFRFECPVCMKKIANEIWFKRHLAKHEGDTNVFKIFHCESCGKSVKTEQELNAHFEQEHQGSYNCDFCHMKYHNPIFLRNHLECHETEKKNWYCNFCFRGYTHKQFWEIHRKIAHVGNERMFCDEDKCAEVFGGVEELNEHLKKHLEERRNKEKDKPEEENGTGEGEEKEKGPETEENVGEGPVANDKPEKNVGEAPKEPQEPEGPQEEPQIYTCGLCGWGFLKKYSLTLHKLVHVPHDKDVGYKCPYPDCGKIIKLKDRLISHYNHNHGEKQKPFECHLCHHHFSHFLWFKTHLQLHQEKNSGRKFVCGKCSAEFEDSIYLSFHKKEHLHHKKGGRRWFPEEEPTPTTDRARRGPGRPRGSKTKTGDKPNTRNAELVKGYKEEQEKWRHVPCEVCQKVCGVGPLLRKHIEKEHDVEVPEEEKTFQCHFCHLKFKWKQLHQLHKESLHMQTHKFECDAEGCEQRFDSCEALNEHLHQVHLEKPMEEEEETPVLLDLDAQGQSETKEITKVKTFFKCDQCQWLFATQDYFNLHRLNHTVPVDYQQIPCPHCENIYPSLIKLKNHWNQEHGNKIKPYRCPECPARFFMPHGLRNHKLRHERRSEMQPGERVYCVDCNKSFRDIVQLDFHRRIHNLENYIACPEGCGEKYADRERLNRHLKKMHGKGERYPCSECGTPFLYQFEMRLHMKWTHGPPKYECDICLKKFRRPGALKRHRARHNPKAVQELVCDECGKMFRSEEGLKYHVGSVHTPHELKKFSCVYCPYKTHRRMLYRCHMERCMRNKGIPYDEEKYGKLPTSQKKPDGPKKKPGRKPGWSRKKKEEEEEEEEEEMEEKSTTEEEEDGRDEEETEEKVDVETGPQNYPHLQPQMPPSTTTSVINAILANLTGIPDIGGTGEQEVQKRRRGRPSKNMPSLAPAVTTSSFQSTVDQQMFQSMAGGSGGGMQIQFPQLFGNNPGGQYQNWLHGTAAAPQQPQYFQQQRQEVKPDFHGGQGQQGHASTPPPTTQQQQQQIMHGHQNQMAYTPSPTNHVYSPPLPNQPQNLQYPVTRR